MYKFAHVSVLDTAFLRVNLRFRASKWDQQRHRTLAPGTGGGPMRIPDLLVVRRRDEPGSRPFRHRIVGMVDQGHALRITRAR